MALTDRFEGSRFPATPPVPAAPEPVSAPRESAAAGRRRLPAGGRRSYAAGDINRLTASFARTPMAFDVHVQQSQRVTRARSREAARNNPLIKRYLGLLVSNVIGAHGIQLPSQPQDQEREDDKTAPSPASWTGRQCSAWGYGRSLVTVSCSSRRRLAPAAGPGLTAYGRTIRSGSTSASTHHSLTARSAWASSSIFRGVAEPITCSSAAQASTLPPTGAIAAASPPSR